MADDPKPEPKPEPKPDPEPKPEPKPDPELGDAGQRALAAERAERKKSEKALADAQAKLKELEDAGKSETQKLTDRVTQAEKDLADASNRAMRLEVAAEKGLTAKQAGRLVGKNREELEADADALLEEFGGKKPPPGGRPKEDLRGGGDPNETPDEKDPRKLAERVPRR